MSLGELFDECRAALRSAAAAMNSGDGPQVGIDLLTAETARHAVYAALARCAGFLSGGNLTLDRAVLAPDAARLAAHGVLRERGQQANKLFAVLRAAAAADDHPPAVVPLSPVSRSLRHAADVVGAAADLIAGHVPAYGSAPTPEGVAIRSGGASREGLALVARVAVDALAADRAWTTWSAAGRTALGGAAPTPAAITWTTATGLDDLLHGLIRRSTGTPNLRLLDLAPVTGTDTPVTARDPMARIRAVRDWMRLNPGDIDASHHRTATQLGFGIAVLANASQAALAHSRQDDRDRFRVAAWRAAAVAAVHLSSPRADQPAAFVAAELADLAADVRSLLRTIPTPAARTDEWRPLTTALPGLARTLADGLHLGVARGSIFVAEQALSPRPVGLIYRYQTTTRPATSHDPAIVDLRQRLTECAVIGVPPEEPASSRPAAALAFPVPPRPGVQQSKPVPPSSNPAAPLRHRHR